MGIVENRNEKVANDLELESVDFVEFSDKNHDRLQSLFNDFGFSMTHQDPKRKVEYFAQNDIRFLLNSDPATRGFHFSSVHGPAISAMGWRFKDAQKAYKMALDRGAKPADRGDYFHKDGAPLPAIMGIGDSLIYFTDRKTSLLEQISFVPATHAKMVPNKGFQEIDHLTNNVYLGTMIEWADFYKKIFGFYEVRYFDIKGKKTCP